MIHVPSLHSMPRPWNLLRPGRETCTLATRGPRRKPNSHDGWWDALVAAQHADDKSPQSVPLSPAAKPASSGLTCIRSTSHTHKQTHTYPSRHAHILTSSRHVIAPEGLFLDGRGRRSSCTTRLCSAPPRRRHHPAMSRPVGPPATAGGPSVPSTRAGTHTPPSPRPPSPDYHVHMSPRRLAALRTRCAVGPQLGPDIHAPQSSDRLPCNLGRNLDPELPGIYRSATGHRLAGPAQPSSSCPGHMVDRIDVSSEANARRASAHPAARQCPREPPSPNL